MTTLFLAGSFWNVPAGITADASGTRGWQACDTCGNSNPIVGSYITHGARCPHRHAREGYQVTPVFEGPQQQAEAAPAAEPATAPVAPAGSMVAKYAGRCMCGARVVPGTRIVYARKAVVSCEGCGFGVHLSNDGAAAIVREGGAGKLDPAEVRELVAGGWVSASDAMNSDF